MPDQHHSPEPEVRLGAWIRDWGNALTVAMLLYASFYLVWTNTGWGSPMLRHAIGLLAFLPMNAAATALAWHASARPNQDPGVARGLRLFGFGYLCCLVGNTAQLYVTHVLHADSTDSWINLLYFGMYPLVLAGLLSFPRERRVENEHRKFLLDAATVLIAAGVLVWHLVLRPTVVSADRSLFGTGIALGYPLGDVLLMLGLTTVLLQRPSATRRWAMGMVIAALTVYMLSDLANDLVLEEVGYLGFQWTDVGFMVSYCFLGVAFQSFADRSAPADAPAELSPQQQRLVQPFSPMPYLFAALCYALLVSVALRRWPEPLSVLVMGTVAVTALILVRQIAAVRENARLRAETTARENEARFRALVQHSSDVITIVEADTRVRYVSPSVTRVFGYQPSELEGTCLTDLLHPEDLARGVESFSAATARPGVTSPTEWRIRHRDGRWLHVEALGTNLLHEPTVRGIVVNSRDVSERKALEAQLTHQAFHDPLTGLSNRALFLDRVSHALTLAQRHAQTLAILFLDLDNFKTVNDSLGHSAGDRLLVAVAHRLVASVRTSDTVARLGGDEFAILIEDAVGDMSAASVAERITQALPEPFSIEGKEVFISASIGIAVAGTEDSASDLLRNADMAMYLAKSRGRARYEAFESRMHREAMERLELEGDLRRAVDRSEFFLLYQPIMTLRDGLVSGMEALLRWSHPRRGTIMPSAFIPLAEDTGLIVPLGQWVLREACRQARQWQLLSPTSTSALTLTVNISGHQLQHATIVDDVRGALAESGLDAGSLVLEITESVLMQHTETMLQRLQALKSVGVRLAIDDFGTGYSSLSYLQRFPIDILKIAKPFVDGVGAGANDSALARAIIALGDTLQLHTIAEGIELKEQLSGLQELGCEMCQGYYFAKPLSREAMQMMLESNRPGDTTVSPRARSRR